LGTDEHETQTVPIPRPDPRTELRAANKENQILYREMNEAMTVNYIIIIILVPLLLENDGLGLLSAHGL
jgi:hypothetical protein